MLKTTCYSCHSGSGASGGFHADQYLEAGATMTAQNKWQMALSAVQAGNMPLPPLAPLTTCQTSMFQQWVAGGVQPGVAPSPSPTPTIIGLTPPNRLDGAGIYSRRCATCHGPLESSERLGASADQIRWALNNVSTMAFLQGFVNDDDVISIAWALDGNSTTPADQADHFVCHSDLGKAPSVIRRLTKFELSNTINDLLGATIGAAVASYVNAVPNDNTVLGYDNVDKAVSDEHVSTYLDLAYNAADIIVKSTTNLKAIVGTCASTRPLTSTCLNNFIKNFGQRAFRRPLTTAETTTIKGIYTDQASADETMAIRQVLTYFLYSPNFTYRVETSGGLVAGQTNVYSLSDYELASRISYLIWGTMPDATLFTQASKGLLVTDAGFSAAVDYALASPLAKQGFQHFYSQWLALNQIKPFGYSANFLAGVDTTNLRADMIQELSDYVDYITWTKNGTYQDLMTANASFAKTPQLASVYGVASWVPGQAPVSFPGHTRDGLFSHAALLVSGTDGQHPILRGKRVQLQALCGSLPPPDPSVAGNLPVPMAGISTRELFTQKTADPACMKCHTLMNPFGFALSNYDALGRYQTVENLFDMSGNFIGTAPVNSFVDMVVNPPTTVLVSGSSEMGTVIAESGTGAACMVTQWNRYALSRATQPVDGCSLNTQYNSLNGTGIQDMIRNTVKDPAFRVRAIGN